MLLGANGQNIYPEEIEDKLNSLPFVVESVVVQRGEKLYGLVFPDFEEAEKQGMSRADIEKLMEENRQQLNQVIPPYSKVSAFEITDEEFAKTPKRSIKRFMYK